MSKLRDIKEDQIRHWTPGVSQGFYGRLDDPKYNGSFRREISEAREKRATGGYGVRGRIGTGWKDEEELRIRDENPKQAIPQPLTLADEFRQNQQGISNQIFENTAQLERRRLADEMTGVKRDYNRRGLLTSGLRQGAQGKSEARSATSLAQTRQDVNRQISDQQRLLDDQAARKEMGALQTQAAISDQILGQAISNMQARNALVSDLGRAGGQVIGSYYGSKG